MKRPVTLTIAVVLQWVAAVIAVFSGFDLIAAAFEMSKAGVATQVEAALDSLLSPSALAGEVVRPARLVAISEKHWLMRSGRWTS